MTRLLDPAWWRSVAGALGRTALAALVPFIPALFDDPASSWKIAALTVGLTVIAAAASALRTMPDLTASPWWEVAVQRALRQFGQVLATATASAALLTDVDWRAVLTVAGASAVSTLVIAALDRLPSAPQGAVVSGYVANTHEPEHRA